jgi:Uma2 family endonuclease
MLRPKPMQPQPAAYTEDEYIAREREADHKSEFLRGWAYAMAGASPRHNLIVANLLGEFRAGLRGRPCVVLASDQRVCVEPTGLYTYPDVTVVCGPLRTHPRFDDTLLNPSIVVEVLSPSTEAYDRGIKFAHYRRLESLGEYVLVSQSERLVEHFARERDGSWRLTTWTGGQRFALPSAGFAVDVDEAYQNVDLLAPSPEAGPALPRPKTLG